MEWVEDGEESLAFISVQEMIVPVDGIIKTHSSVVHVWSEITVLFALLPTSLLHYVLK